MARKQEVKQRQFNIPKDFIGTFFTELEGSGLSYDILEYDEDEELIVNVVYSAEQRETVMDLIEILDEYLEEQGGEETDDE